MAKLLLILATSFAVAFCLTPVVRRLALRLGAVDRPGSRSVHHRPVPFFGGAAIFVAFSLTIWLFIGLGHKNLGLLAGGVLILPLGMADDYGKARGFQRPAWLFESEGRGLRPWVKIVGQVLAGLVLALGGAEIAFIHLPVLGYVFFDVWKIPVTILWVVGAANVINLADGLDGLAAGITAIAALTLLAAALITGQPAVAAALSAALLGSAAGFLPWNWAPAQIFMGDAGSMFLGYTLAAIAVEGTLKGPAIVALAVPLLAIGLPVFDTLFAIVRRWRGGRPIGAADRGHLHHRLLALGLPVKDAVLIMYLVSGWLAVSALAVARLDFFLGSVILGFVLVSLFFVVKRLGMIHVGRRP